MKALNNLLDFAVLSRTIRALLRYAANRSEGLQYGSYKLEDEVALALSFVTPTRRGGVFDSGANNGDWSRLFLAANPTIDKLIVIEPQAIHGELLSKLLAENDCAIVEHVAVGAEQGVMTLYADAAGSSFASLYHRDLTHIGYAMTQQEETMVTTLDALAQKHGIDHVAFLKLDLEGHELEALKGAKHLLDRQIVDALSFEFGGCNIDSRTYIKDFWSLLVHKYNFSFYRLLPNRRLKHLSKYSESLEQFSWQNILACAPGIHPKWKVLE